MESIDFKRKTRVSSLKCLYISVNKNDNQILERVICLEMRYDVHIDDLIVKRFYGTD